MHKNDCKESYTKKEPIRILHVLGRLDRGGAETMVINLYRNINRNKVQFDFIVHTEDKCDYDEEIKSLGGKIYNIPRYRGNNHIQYKNAWSRFFEEHKEYKIIHGHVRSTASIYLRIAKKYERITIAHSHNTSSGKGLSAVVKNILQCPIRYIADYLFACSGIAGEWLYGAKACKKDNFYILNNAIDTQKFIYNESKRTKKRKEFQIEDKFVIGHVGRFHTQKNHYFLIDIFKEIHDRDDNAVLMLVGDGELQHPIEKKVKNLGLDNNVIFAGVRSDIPELLQAMDIFVFPSLYEGLPVTVIEAQAAGLQCIISDTITNEVCITPNVCPISINKTNKLWADTIISKGKVQRTNTKDYIEKNGYDIFNTVEKLTIFYNEVQNM